MRSPEAVDSQIMRLSDTCSWMRVPWGKSRMEALRKKQPCSLWFGAFPETQQWCHLIAKELYGVSFPCYVMVVLKSRASKRIASHLYNACALF